MAGWWAAKPQPVFVGCTRSSRSIAGMSRPSHRDGLDGRNPSPVRALVERFADGLSSRHRTPNPRATIPRRISRVPPRIENEGARMTAWASTAS